MTSSFDPTAIWIDAQDVDKADIRNTTFGLGKVKIELDHGGFVGLSPSNYSSGDDQTQTHLSGIDTELQGHFPIEDTSDYSVTAFNIGVDGRSSKEYRRFSSTTPLLNFPAGLSAKASGSFEIPDGQTATLSSAATVSVNGVPDLGGANPALTLNPGIYTWWRRQTANDIALRGPIDGETLHVYGDIDFHGHNVVNSGNFVDWTADQGATDIHANNIPDLSSTYQLSDAILSSISALASDGLVTRTAAGTVAARSIAVGSNLSVTNASCVSGNPTISMANMAQATVKGRATGAGTGAPVDLTASQLNAIIATAVLNMGSNIISNYRSQKKTLSGAQTLNSAAVASGDTVIFTGAAATWTLASRLNSGQTAQTAHIIIRNRGSGDITIAAGGLTIVGDTGPIAPNKSASLEWEHDGTTERVWIEISA